MPRPLSDRLKLGILLSLILLVHLTVAVVTRNGLIKDDADSYVTLARNLVAGYGYVFAPNYPPTSWRAPGYPVYLSGVFALTGGSLEMARVSHAFLWVLSSFLTYLLAQKLTGSPSTALVAAGCVGFYPEFVGSTALLWSENLYIPVFLLTLNGLVEATRNNASPFVHVGTGLLVGLAVLTRSTSVILFPVIWFIALTRSASPGRWTRALVVSVVGLTIVGAWSARNYAIHKRFILVESNVGFNLYVGNSPETTVFFAWKKLAGIDNDQRYHNLIRGMNEADKNAALTKEAVGFIKADPLRTLMLGFGKLCDFWLPDFFIAMNLRSGSMGSELQILWQPFLILSASTYLFVWFMALREIVRARNQWYVGFLLVVVALYALPHGLIYGASRYHLPLMPLLIILAAPEIERLIESRREVQPTPTP